MNEPLSEGPLPCTELSCAHQSGHCPAGLFIVVPLRQQNALANGSKLLIAALTRTRGGACGSTRRLATLILSVAMWHQFCKTVYPQLPADR